MGGPGSCKEEEARAAGQVVHPHDSAEWAEDMLDRVQDSQQAWRSKMEDYLVAMGVASLEILEPQTHLSVGRQRPELHRPDTMIGLKDWEYMRAFHYSGWEVPAAVENKRQEQLAKWHIRMILRNG
jgi:hypothetical protein